MSVTVPVDPVPPGTVGGFSDTDRTLGALIPRLVVTVVPFNVPDSVVDVFAATAVVPIVKVPVVAPAAIVAVAGMVTVAPDWPRVTVRPPVGAGLLMVTVPVALVPPRTGFGLAEIAVITGGVMVKVAVLLPL